jgi:hypothetical protein
LRRKNILAGRSRLVPEACSSRVASSEAASLCVAGATSLLSMFWLGSRSGRSDKAIQCYRAGKGFSQRKPGNRAKSPSVEQRINPCSIASAARCASGTRFARPAASLIKGASISRCRSVGVGTLTNGQSSHASICRQAAPIVSGRWKMRGLVTSRANPSKLGQGRDTGAVPFNRSSSQLRAASC